MKDIFDKKDQSYTTRQQLHGIKQNSDVTIEEFSERIDDMAVEGYEGMSDYFINTVTMHSLLHGCTVKRAFLVT
jgi:hypothetical protein